MLHRRRFLKCASSALFLAGSPGVVRGRHLNSKLQFAGIGCDGKGWSDIQEMSGHDMAEPVAFCDIDLARTESVRQLRPDATVFQDFREMLDKLGDKIDAVTVSTPDHMHAFIVLEAMRQGKHVYCQKPLTHNVWEARQVRKQAANSGVITRMGNQIHSHTYYRTAVNVIQSGAIGKIRQVHSWVAAGGHGKSFHIDRPSPSPVPESVDWELWIGVAPMRPYVDGRVYHPWGWRDWQDFGNGALGDFGCHILDPVFTALKIVEPPIELTAEHSGMNDEVWPAQNTVDFTFPGTEYTVNDRLPIRWNDGGRLPSVKGSHVPPTVALPASGSLFIGEKGSLVLPHVGRLRLYPQDRFTDYTVEEADDLNHYHGWVDGCISGVQPSDGFDYAGRLTESVLLGNIAVRFRTQKLQWNSETMKFTNVDEPNVWLKRGYRDGWEPTSGI